MILTLVKGGPSGGTLAAIVFPALGLVIDCIALTIYGLVSFPDPTPTTWKRDYTPWPSTLQQFNTRLSDPIKTWTVVNIKDIVASFILP